MHEPILNVRDGLILQDGGTVDRADWECDVCTARFECKSTLVGSLVPPWGAKHPTFPTLTKTSHRIREAKGGISSLDCTYRGLVDGIAPPVRERNSLSLVGVQLTLALNVNGVTGKYEPTIEVEVYLPQTQFDYFTTRKPRGPRFRGKVNYVEGAFEIAARRGSQRQAAINIMVAQSLAEAMAAGKDATASAGYFRRLDRRGGEYNGVAHVVNTAYDDQQVAVNLWRVSETSGVRILPPDESPTIRMAGTTPPAKQTEQA